MRRSLRSPFLASLSIALAATLVLAILAGLLSFRAIEASVERTAKEDILREVRLLTDRAPERGALPEAASLTVALGRRIFEDGDGAGGSLYLLVDANGARVAGNVERWPKDKITQTGQWARTNGAALGTKKGPVLLRTEDIAGGEFRILVGRKLTAHTALRNRFVPALGLSVLGLGLGLCGLLLWLNQGYQRKLSALNTVFSQVRGGELSARVGTQSPDAGSDALAELGQNIDTALDEVQRLMASLDAFSQVAAHELNHAVSNMRGGFITAGHTEAARSADDLLELISQILDLAKVEATPGFEMKRFDLREAANAAASLFADTFEESGVALEMIRPGTATLMLGSQPLITSAIVNLLSNAAKFAPNGSDVTLSVVAGADQLTLSVQDLGPGLATKDISELSRRAAQQGGEGHGFGLRHVQAVAIRHGAQLTLCNTRPGLKADIVFVRGAHNLKG